MANGKRARPPSPSPHALKDAQGLPFTIDLSSSEALAPAPPRAKPSGKANPAPKPHHVDHRKRLRARFSEAGAEALADYELLEMFLFRTIPRADTKPLAKALLARFGSLSGVLAAEPARIAEVPGAGESVALDLKATQALLIRSLQGDLRRQNLISSFSKLVEYCRAAMAQEPREHFRALFLDTKHHLIADEVLWTGTLDQAAVYPREILRRALELSAASIVLAHNHPGGDPAPSSADIAITREIVTAAKALNITVIDHIIVGRRGVASFKSMGLI